MRIHFVVGFVGEVEGWEGRDGKEEGRVIRGKI